MDERLRKMIKEGNLAIASHSTGNIVVIDTFTIDNCEVEKIMAEHQTQPILVIGHSQPTVEKSDVSHLLQEKLYELTRQSDYQTEFLSGREKRKNRRKKERNAKKRTGNV